MEQQKVTGTYRVGENGRVRLPLLAAALPAGGMTAGQFAHSVEEAYKAAGIYTRPVIEVEILQGTDQPGGPAVVSVGGQVRRAGEATFRKNMTVLQALDAVGGRNEFGGRNVLLFRDGHQYCLDFNNLRHKNIVLHPGDSLQVEQKGIIDRWRGQDTSVAKLLERAP